MGFFGRRKPEARTESRVEFLGEQNGPVEQKLKLSLSTEFAKSPRVSRAYLARVGFQPENKTSVAVCVISDGDQQQIVNRIGVCFAQVFNKSVFLDILFPNQTQEDDLKRVCRAFYSKAV